MVSIKSEMKRESVIENPQSKTGSEQSRGSENRVMPAEPAKASRRLAIGAEVLSEGGVHFRVWATKPRKVEVVLEDAAGKLSRPLELAPDGNGYFSGVLADARAGTLYRYRLDDESDLYADPASRFQPAGPRGPSMVIDPTEYRWSDNHWQGVRLPGQVIYEMHIGTFTREGTWHAAMEELEELARIGITVIEVMPVNEFPGQFGWGYDGVDLFAPTHLYGEPDDFRRFVDRAHSLGLGVILDVVYNHIGPDGNSLKLFSEEYFTDRYKTDWGEALNYDGKNSGPVREFFVSNAGYWIDEYHLDGLRLDATDNIYDSSEKHVLAEISERVRQSAGRRSTILIAENERQDVKLVRAVDQGGCGLDGLWNDDFHHTARVALTGQREAYYMDYCGSPQELISAVKWGYLYQGQWYKWQRKRRGSPTRGLKPWTFVHYLNNHDQISNSGFGERIHLSSHRGCYRALTALLLLGPATPLLFQGQEFGASSRFMFFADHRPELAKLVRKGRLEFVAQFPSLANSESQARIPDPSSWETFQDCKLNFRERETHKEIYKLHRNLLALRREDPVLRSQGSGGIDGAVLGPKVFALRFFGIGDDGDRLFLVNLDVDFSLDPAPEPLLAPVENTTWAVLWSSEHPDYGGRGILPLAAEGNWMIQGFSALVLTSERGDQSSAKSY
jgi:maltooligosyltrehalose trehalohydrolase